MSKDQETKIVRPLQTANDKIVQEKQPNYVPWLISIVAAYFILVLFISFLPLSGYMKVLSLFCGTFLLFDILHSAKWYLKNLHGK